MYEAMKRRTVKKPAFYFLYCIIIGSLIFIILENVAQSILDKRVDNSLKIFNCILCNEENVLEAKPFYRGAVRSREFSMSVSTNGRGYREEFEFDDNSIDVAFMGDSFTFGWGVELVDRYSIVAAKEHPKLKMVSLSYNNGFQPEHYEYFLDKHPDLKPKALFIGLYLGNDLDSDLNETVIERDESGKILKIQLPYRDLYQGALINRISYRFGVFAVFVDKTSLGKILAIKVNSSDRWRTILNTGKSVIPNTQNRLNTELGNFDQLNLRAIRSLKEIRQMIKMRNGELHVLLIPQNFLVGNVQNPHIDPNNKHGIDEIREKNGLTKTILNICEDEALNCHELSRILESSDYFERDAHWNESGHQKVGQYVSKLITGIINEN
jgi:hypothetical protein